MNMFNVFQLIAIIANLLLTLTIIYLDSGNKKNMIFSLFTSALFFWGIGEYFSMTSISIQTAIFWEQISKIGSTMAMVFLLHHIIHITRIQIKKIHLVFMYLPPTILLAFAFFKRELFTESTRIINNWGYYLVEGEFNIVFRLFIVAITIFTLVIGFRSIHKIKNSSERTSIKHILLSIFIPLVGGIITEIILPLWGVVPPPMTIILTTVTAACIVFVIFKHKFLRPKIFTLKRKIAIMFMLFIIICLITSFVLTNSSLSKISENYVQTTLKRSSFERARMTSSTVSFQKETVDVITRNIELLHSSKIVLLIQNIVDNNEHIQSITVLQNNEVLTSTSTSIIDFNNQRFEEISVVECTDSSDRCIRHVSHTQNLTIIIDFHSEDINDITAPAIGDFTSGDTYIVSEKGTIISKSHLNSLTDGSRSVSLEEIQHCGDDSIRNYRDYRGVYVIGFKQAIEGTHWCLFSEVDKREAESRISELERFIILVYVAIFIFFIWATDKFAESISRELRKLQEAAKNIGKGNLHQKLSYKHKDEIGELHSSIGEMQKNLLKSSDHLKKLNKDLELRVKRRTEEIENKNKELEKMNKMFVNRELQMIELKKRLKK